MSNPLQQPLVEKHTLLASWIFVFKSLLLSLKRGVQNKMAGLRRYQVDVQLCDAATVAYSNSPLWPTDDTKDNWILTAGKVENLRVASRALHGIEIPEGGIFSFWQHVGYPSRMKGYVLGREVREGCIIPSIAGGLCQLSNALYDAALQAGFEILERHRHSVVIAGSAAARDRDATVKWNYIDLRFRVPCAVRIEVRLDAEQLVVQFKAQSHVKQLGTPTLQRLASKVNDCYSCGNTRCFQHPRDLARRQLPRQTCYILDESWPEYDAYLQVSVDDLVLLPLRNNRLTHTQRYHWQASQSCRRHILWYAGLYRALRLRLLGRNNVFSLSLILDEKVAKQAVKKIPFASTHVVVSQNFLPAIYASGALDGRSFDVLMTCLPLVQLQTQLDNAWRLHPDSQTLHDFRADAHLVNLEQTALARASKIITPHPQIAALFPQQAVLLAWHLPELPPQKIGHAVLFPAAAHHRKGCLEMRALARKLGLRLLILGEVDQHFWQGVHVEKFLGRFHEVGLVVYPTFIEHQPRLLLKALALKIPVVTTLSSGLSPSALVSIVREGDLQGFEDEIANRGFKSV